VFKDEGHKEINDDRGTGCEKGQVNEVHADTGGVDTQFLSPPGADPKSLLFKP
jgi:hypothetical protein